MVRDRGDRGKLLAGDRSGQTDGSRGNAGPGKAWTALEQGEYLFELAERKPSFIKVPVALMDGIIGFLDLLAKVFPGLQVLCRASRDCCGQGGCILASGCAVVQKAF